MLQIGKIKKKSIINTIEKTPTIDDCIVEKTPTINACIDDTPTIVEVDIPAGSLGDGTKVTEVSANEFALMLEESNDDAQR